MIEERYLLAKERIEIIQTEDVLKEPYKQYFTYCSEWILGLIKLREQILDQHKKMTTFKKLDSKKELEARKELQARNKLLYEDILGENYDTSYANPAYTSTIFEKQFAPIASFLVAQFRSLIEACFENDLFELVIHMELFLELYTSFGYSFNEFDKPPKHQEIKQIIYWFFSDYFEPMIQKKVKNQLDPTCDFATNIIMNSDLKQLSYLYSFGEYISDNEIQIATFLNKLPQSTIDIMADAFTKGYEKGFLLAKKDLSKKKVVNIRYSVGFERVIKKAIQNFSKMGLKPTIYRSSNSIFYKRGMNKIGYFGGIANQQYDYDHKDDQGLFLDKRLIKRKIEGCKTAYEQQKEWASFYSGSACMEVFGETAFVPINKNSAISLTKQQQQLSVEYAAASGEIVNKYCKAEERSYTIIAFPTPEIGPQFEEIFQEVIRINTLDYKQYETLQQTIIDALDQGEKVHVLGAGNNETDLTIMLQSLTDEKTQTKFENCVADVNIPVGEVFTTPVLKGTNGVLHVSNVFLGEFEFKNLRITFQDGFVKDYSCANFQNERQEKGLEDENKKYIKDNILFHHDSLPMGEFAIGTNTIAFMMAKKYHIENKLPILIAEKMGPHFAVGDTCYSHSEDINVYNPNGKEIIAKDNEISLLRKDQNGKAYFHCHTDITIPYNEIKLLQVIHKDGTNNPIIKDGRFVLPGCEKLNEPFEN